mmetsp:Transcript_40063/g.87377  ORF Transcript_40063/g.87377 Transcript_40063/m.87377 type:complete len:363 (-) Transcript_40063:379-1467(-)
MAYSYAGRFPCENSAATGGLSLGRLRHSAVSRKAAGALALVQERLATRRTQKFLGLGVPPCAPLHGAWLGRPPEACPLAIPCDELPLEAQGALRLCHVLWEARLVLVVPWLVGRRRGEVGVSGDLLLLPLLLGSLQSGVVAHAIQDPLLLVLPHGPNPVGTRLRWTLTTQHGILELELSGPRLRLLRPRCVHDLLGRHAMSRRFPELLQHLAVVVPRVEVPAAVDVGLPVRRLPFGRVVEPLQKAVLHVGQPLAIVDRHRPLEVIRGITVCPCRPQASLLLGLEEARIAILHTQKSFLRLLPAPMVLLAGCALNVETPHEVFNAPAVRLPLRFDSLLDGTSRNEIALKVLPPPLGLSGPVAA